MNWIRSNIAYVVLALVAVGLVFFTIRLQNLVLVTQPDDGVVQVAALTTATTLPAATPFPSPTPFPTATPFPTPITAPSTDVPPTPTLTPIPVLPAETPLAPSVEPPAPNSVAPVAQVQVQDPAEQFELAILGATNLTTSEDDAVLIEMIKNNPRAIGFIRYSSYQANQDLLRAVKIQTQSGIAIEPSAETVASGVYPFSRPLLLYASPAEIKAKPQLEGYIGCYLNRIYNEIEAIGYTPPSLAMYRDALEIFEESCQLCQKAAGDSPLFPEVPACTAEGATSAPVVLTGGSTVYPLSARMIDIYKEVGFPGEITIEDIGTSAGFERFCEKSEADIVNASRLIKDKEEAACQASNRSVRGFPVGLDLVVVVVSRENTFVEQLSFNQLRWLFTKTIRWAEINPAWPVEMIVRAIPNKSRGTFAFFVEELYANSTDAPLAIAQVAPTLQAEPTATQAPPSPTPLPPTAEPPSSTLAPATATVEPPTPTPTLPLVTLTNTPAPPADIRLGYIDRGDQCALITAIAQQILKQNFGLIVASEQFNEAEALFGALASTSVQEHIDITFCYTDPDDRTYLEQHSGFIFQTGTVYQRVNQKSYMVMQNAFTPRAIRNNSCVLKFLKAFNLENTTLTEENAATWINNHTSLVNRWTSCT